MRAAVTLAICLVALPHALTGRARALGTAPEDDSTVCDRHGDEVEATLQLPPGLLRAIGRVESGQRNPTTGRLAPWPWTLNANGQGRFLANATAAAEAVRNLRGSGTENIDAGCYQVNLLHHPQAFQSIEAAFDPAMNAAYAGSFLKTLRLRLGSWDAAVAAYHSSTPERGEPYRQLVYAAWQGHPAEAPGVAHVSPLVIRISGPDMTGPEAPVRIWTPSRPGSAASRIALPPPVGGSEPEGPMAVQIPAPTALPQLAIMPAGLTTAQRP